MRLNFPSGFSPGDAENSTGDHPAIIFLAPLARAVHNFSPCKFCHCKYRKGDLVDLDVTSGNHPLNLLVWFVHIFKSQLTTARFFDWAFQHQS